MRGYAREGANVQHNSMTPALNKPLPEFEALATGGVKFTPAAFAGKTVVLYFYPKDNTPGCTTQACEFRDNIFAFREAGAVILGISVDDVQSHEEFAREHSLPFTILADSAKSVARSYGVLHKLMGVLEVARRDTFIVDPQGRIARHYEKVDPKGHSQFVLAELKALKAAAPKG